MSLDVCVELRVETLPTGLLLVPMAHTYVSGVQISKQMIGNAATHT